MDQERRASGALLNDNPKIQRNILNHSQHYYYIYIEG